MKYRRTPDVQYSTRKKTDKIQTLTFMRQCKHVKTKHDCEPGIWHWKRDLKPKFTKKWDIMSQPTKYQNVDTWSSWGKKVRQNSAITVQFPKVSSCNKLQRPTRHIQNSTKHKPEKNQIVIIFRHSLERPDIVANPVHPSDRAKKDFSVHEKKDTILSNPTKHYNVW